MNRYKAIEIAAGNTSMTAQEFGDDRQWALAVIGRANALLEAMGEADAVEYCDETCCAATEARVVAEIVAWLRADRLHITALEIERGDWRAKAER